MKQLLIVAVLAMTSFSAKAQFFHNDTQCDLEFREVCIDVSTAPSCTIVGTGMWVPAPATKRVSIPGTGCSVPPDEIGYEIRYAASTGCSASIIIKQPGTVCTAYPDMDVLPACPCNPSGTDLQLHCNGANVHVNP